MKSVWIINHYAIPPKFGGLNRHYYFSRYLGKQGYNIKIFTSSKIHNSSVNMIKPEDKRKFKIVDFDGVQYIFLKSSEYEGNGFSRIKNMISFACFAYFFLKKEGIKRFGKPDLIYTSSPSLLASVSAVLLAKKIKIPVITEIRDLWPESIVAYKNISRKNPIIILLYALEKWLYKCTDALVFTTEGGKDYLKERGICDCIDLKKVYSLNNGVDLFDFEKNLSNKLNDDDLLRSDTFKIIYTGSIREVNDLSILLDVARSLKDTQRDVKFIVYGEGTQKDTLIKRCKAEGIDNICFKGHVSREFIPFILSKANINIIIVKQTDLTRFGTSYNKLFDYMASKKPIISNISVNYDLLQRYNCGVTSKSSGAEDLKNAIKSIYNLPKAKYEELCRNAGEAAKDYDYKVLSAKLKKIIDSVAKV
ncbi:MAG: glycosyltransferase family 4 protein [Oscillospiraceae bacterium]|nr:glycosyltransferase family 4 protein [Oscillospiraceae bacterium]